MKSDGFIATRWRRPADIYSTETLHCEHLFRFVLHQFPDFNDFNYSLLIREKQIIKDAVGQNKTVEKQPNRQDRPKLHHFSVLVTNAEVKIDECSFNETQTYNKQGLCIFSPLEVEADVVYIDFIGFCLSERTLCRFPFEETVQ